MLSRLLPGRHAIPVLLVVAALTASLLGASTSGAAETVAARPSFLTLAQEHPLLRDEAVARAALEAQQRRQEALAQAEVRAGQARAEVTARATQEDAARAAALAAQEAAAAQQAAAVSAAAARVAAEKATAAAAPVSSAAPGSTPSRAAAPAPAAASGCDGAPGWEQVRGEKALRRLDVRPSDAGYRIEFLAARGNTVGMTMSSSRLIEIYVRPCGSLSDNKLLWVIAHETGHAVDLSTDSARRHSDWLATRGVSSREWYGCNRCTDFDTPAGDFAEVFAYAQTGLGGMFGSRVAPQPSQAQLAALRPMLAPRY